MVPTATALTSTLLKAAERLDPAAIRRGLDVAASTLGSVGCVDEVLLPVMRQIGLWWAAGRCSYSQERMATEAVRSWLDGRSAVAPRPRPVAPILLACGPRDQHTIGVESLALLLRLRGLPCRVMGTRTSAFELLTATRATAPAAVVVASHLTAARSHAAAAINGVHRQGYPVYFAGNAFVDDRARIGVCGTYLGSSMLAACARLAPG